MDYIKINNLSIPYPNDFTLNPEPIIANEITTLSGYTYADIVGVKYSDTTLNWDYLVEEDLLALLNETNPLKGTFTLKFSDPEDVELVTRNLTALRIGRVTTKTRFKESSGRIIWTGISITVRFPYSLH